MNVKITPDDRLMVYETAMLEGVDHERAVRCASDVAAGHWEAQTVGELRAQLTIMRDELERDDRRVLFTFMPIGVDSPLIDPADRQTTPQSEGETP